MDSFPKKKNRKEQVIHLAGTIIITKIVNHKHHKRDDNRSNWFLVEKWRLCGLD